ncbi:MAG: hypothetical protein P4L16_03600 [Chlamydiales bacterium]|nr:hypothetical protein [Chlamydiales bacterium]
MLIITKLQECTSAWTNIHEEELQFYGVPTLNIGMGTLQTLSSSVEIIGGVALTAIGKVVQTAGNLIFSKNIERMGIDCAQEGTKWVKDGVYHVTLAAVNLLSLGIFGYISRIGREIPEELEAMEAVANMKKIAIFSFLVSYTSIGHNLCYKTICSVAGTIFFAMGKMVGFNTSDSIKCTLLHLKESLSTLPADLLNILSLGTLSYLAHMRNPNLEVEQFQDVLSKAQAFPALGLIGSIAKGVFSLVEVTYAATGVIVYGVAGAVLHSYNQELFTESYERALIAAKRCFSGFKHLSYSVLNLATLGIASGIIEQNNDWNKLVTVLCRR